MSTVVESPAARAVLMVRPMGFHANSETAATNELQSVPNATAADVATACNEFDGVVTALTSVGVEVVAFDPPADVDAPDAVFPNNWISTHADGTVVLYPMFASNRRAERQPDLVVSQLRMHGFRIQRTLDLSSLENTGEFVEGTGSLVLDPLHRIAYVALSPRSTAQGVEKFCRLLNYEPCAFTATHASGSAIYHTNVMLSVGAELAIGCFESIRAQEERRRVLARLDSTGKQVLSLSEDQMLHFAANVLELRGKSGPVLAISTNAWSALDAPQRRTVERYLEPCIANVSTLERVGGGGVRCMLAEIHLPSER